MDTIEPRDLSRYLVGRASKELQQRIEEKAEQDPQFRAKLDVTALLVGRPGRSPSALRCLVHSKPVQMCLRWSTVLCLFLGLTGAGAAWAFLTTRPLLSEGFSDNYLDSGKWRPDVHPVVIPENGYVRLLNRGYLVTAKEYSQPISVQLDWRWVDLTGDTLYVDDLSVALRTTGQPKPSHSFEARDGIIVKFHANPGKVSVCVALDTPQIPVRATTAVANLDANSWHRIRITDDGLTVNVYLRELTRSPDEEESLVLQARCPEQFQGHHVAIYNREFLWDVPERTGAAMPHESHIDNVLVKPLR